MKEFICWLFERNQIFTLITVLLSGLISWIISAVYYRKSNRNALKQNVILPIKRKLKETRSYNNYKELEKLSKAFETRYLTKKEQNALSNLLEEYRKVYDYNRSYIYAESLFSHFLKTLKENNVETEVVPEYFEDEMVYYSTPSELYYLVDDVKRIIDDHPPEYDYDKEVEPIENKIKHIFKVYCKRYLEDKEIDFFNQTNVYDIYMNSPIKSEWDNKLSTYYLIEKQFLLMKICE